MWDYVLSIQRLPQLRRGELALGFRPLRDEIGVAKEAISLRSLVNYSKPVAAHIMFVKHFPAKFRLRTSMASSFQPLSGYTCTPGIWGLRRGRSGSEARRGLEASATAISALRLNDNKNRPVESVWPNGDVERYSDRKKLACAPRTA